MDGRRLPSPLRHDPSEDLAAAVGASIEDVELPEGIDSRSPFSPTAIAHQLSRLGAESMIADDLRAELLPPEGQAQIPHPRCG